MAGIPKRVEERIKTGIKSYSKILEQVKKRDINESDTVTIVSDMLADIFGYDKYLDITSEYAIRNTYCDLAIKQNGEVVYLIECKAIGLDLKEDHLRQAIEYSATKGIDWAILTNGQIWKIYKVIFNKPVRAEEVCTFDFLEDNIRDSEFINMIYMLTKEAISKSVIDSFHEQSKLVNKFTISAVVLSDDGINLIRKKLRQMSKQAKVDNDTLENILRDEVLKRELVDSEEIKSALKKLKRLSKKNSTSKKKGVEDRPNYLSGKQLKEEDLSEEQDYHDSEEDKEEKQ